MPPSIDTAHLAARDLTCGYHGKAILEPINLEVSPGGILLLLGPNGAGKSTLIKTLIGAITPISGEVQLAGKPLGGWEPYERAKKLAYVPQQESAYFSFPVREFVLMGRLPFASGMFETHEDHLAAESAMERAKCSNLADRLVTELSGGEQQRVLLARALAQNPSTLVLDEPSSHLDIGHAYQLLDTIKELSANGMAIILAVHDLNWAARLPSQALLLNQGNVAARGSTQDVLRSAQVSTVYNREIQVVDLPDGGFTLVPK